MGKLIKFVFTFILSILLIWALDKQFGQVPPLGKFLDPQNGFWYNAEQALSSHLDSVKVPGIKSDIEILYDEDMIPHVFAENAQDMFFAQGYISAQDRLWQMEFQTYAAAGRIAELIGEKAIDFDRTQRRMGLEHGALNTLKEIEQDDEIYGFVEAYTNGVNAYINQLSYKHLPIEYKLLNYRPEAWTPLKVALLLSYMGNSLSGRDADFENTNLVQLLGKESFDLLFPEYPAIEEPVISKNRLWDFDVIKSNKPDSIIYPTMAVHAKAEEPDANNGSNNWAVHGSKTVNGKPMLANDPHLGLNLPSLWYVMQLNSPGYNSMGGTLPGALGVILGFNDSIAWACTNALRDVRDWYAITFKDESRKEYLFDGKWLKTQVKVEEIKVKGSETIFDSVVYTHYGPIVYDKNFGTVDAKKNYALRWTLHDASNEQRTFIDLNRASNYNDYVKALSHYKNPAQNFAFASASGDIAMWVNGKIPNKWKEQGKFVMDGSRSAFEWQGYIPFEHNPHEKNPARGFVSSANQHPVSPKYPYWGYNDSYEFFRNKRINQLLSSEALLSVEDMMKLQNDNFNIMASEMLPSLLGLVDSLVDKASEQEVIVLLKNWNYWNNANEIGPVYFSAWSGHFFRELWKGLANKAEIINVPSRGYTIQLLLNGSLDSLMMPENTQENLQQLAYRTFQKGLENVEVWKEQNDSQLNWGNYKSTGLKHLAMLDPFSVKNVAIGGDRSIINANTSNHGASWRYIVSFKEDGLDAYGIYPGGQSGNPGSPYYANMVERWRDGEYMKLSFMTNKAALKDRIVLKQVLKPIEISE